MTWSWKPVMGAMASTKPCQLAAASLLQPPPETTSTDSVRSTAPPRSHPWAGLGCTLTAGCSGRGQSQATVHN